MIRGKKKYPNNIRYKGTEVNRSHDHKEIGQISSIVKNSSNSCIPL